MNNCYCSIGHVNLKEDIDVLEQRLLYNYPVISKFNYITVYQNYNDSSKHLIDDYNKVWHKIFGKDVILLPSELSRGHTFGTADSDNAVIDYAKTLPIDYIYKSSNDILLDPQILNVEITDNFDFYFLQGIGYTGLAPFSFDLEQYIQNYMDPKYLYPQTNFYIITKNIDYLNNEQVITNGYEFCKTVPNYSNRVWEYIQDFSCEQFLQQCVIRNKLRYKHIISDKSFMNILTLVKDYKICDCSHKNIYISEVGVCHFQWPDKNVVII